MSRLVLHIDMDAFFASVEQLTRPTLRGRPVLVGGMGGRGVVAGASYEARAFGAHSAMPTNQAKRQVGPGGVVVRPRHAVYSAASHRVFSLVAEQAGVIQQISIDEAFIEPQQLVGATEEEVGDWAEGLRAKVLEVTGLTASIGAGSGKQYAKIASGLAKPDGVMVLPRDTEMEFLAPLPVRKLWGVGAVAGQKLRQIGVETIEDLAALTQKEAEMTLGRAVGLSLWQRARGIDPEPVEPRGVSKSIGAEYTYPKDLTTSAEVDAAVDRAFNAAYRRLLKDGRGARTVSVKLKLADFQTQSRSHSIDYATDNEHVLEKMAGSLVRYPNEVGPIRLVGVSFSGLEFGMQDALFPELQPVALAKDTDVDYEVGVRAPATVAEDLQIERDVMSDWWATQDVVHEEYGHGWIQGVGFGRMTVRFETRATPPGRTKSFATDDPALRPGDPLDSLAWGDR